MIIAPMGAVALAGYLLILLAILNGVILLLWWGWRFCHHRRGTARPPLRTWQWVAAVLLSVLPVSTALMWGLTMWTNYQRVHDEIQEQRQRYFNLPQAIVWGDIVLPAGSHAKRDLLSDQQPLKGDVSDLRTLNSVRFEQAQPLDELFVNALELNGQWLLLELARPHRFGKEDCPAGYTAQFRALQPRTVLEDVPMPIYEALPLRMADWKFDTCFRSAIMMRYWQGNDLVWMDLPDYVQD